MPDMHPTIPLSNLQDRRSAPGRASVQFLLAIPLATVLILSIFIAMIGYFCLYNYQNQVQNHLMVANQIHAISLDIQNEFLLIRENEFDFLANWNSLGYATANEKYIKPSKDYLTQIRSNLDKLSNTITGTKDPNLVGLADNVREVYPLIDAFDAAFGVETAQQNTASSDQSTKDAASQINTALSGIVSSAAKNEGDANLAVQNTLSLTNTILLGSAGLALVIGVVVSIIFGRRIVDPLRQLVDIAVHIGDGSLEQQVSLGGNREVITLGNAFNSLTTRIQRTLDELEYRVKERTEDFERRSAQLQFASEVARDISTTRELDVLLNRAVNLVRDRFKFYHAGIFRIDERGDFAVLRAATGEAGKAMLENEHRLKVGEVGIVGYVTGSGKPRVSSDVGIDAVHFKNPLLPETRSELGLPLKVGSKVIGALDVQSREPSAFSEEDVNILHIMADQLAVAIDNARLFQEAQDNLHQLQSLYGRYSQESWERLGQTKGIEGYAFDSSGVSAIRSQSSIDAPADVSPLQLPLKVRGQSIGTLEIWPGEAGLSSEEIGILEKIRDRISQAMESARLFEEASVRAAREQTLSQLTARFTRSIGLDNLLQTAVKELGQLPNVTEVSVHLGVPENHK